MIKLTRAQRNFLLRKGGAYMRQNPHDDCVAVSDRIFTVMLDNEVEYGLGEFEATEISDYAYGIASFLTARRGW